MSTVNKYIIISPARDEEELIEYTLKSVIRQTIKPLEYIIVNDGSSDGTGKIIEGYSKDHPWIRVIDLPDRGYYTYGNGIITAFNKGLDEVNKKDYEFIVKLDCDLSFDEHYFENLLRQFSLDEKLGIASGQTYFLNGKNRLVWEDAPLDHTVGPCKVYRKECFRDINGLVVSLGWDHIDEVAARMNGWRTRSYPEYKLLHHRIMGSRLGILRGNMRHGHADYITGYHVPYFMIKSFYRLFTKPYLVGSMASFYGFFKNYFIGEKRIVNKEFRIYYRREQIRKLVQKKFWKLYLEKYGITKKIL